MPITIIKTKICYIKYISKYGKNDFNFVILFLFKSTYQGISKTFAKL